MPLAVDATASEHKQDGHPGADSQREAPSVISADNMGKTHWALLSGLRCQRKHSGLYWVSTEESGALEVRREVKVLWPNLPLSIPSP